jgi:hypothetical protein
MEKYSNGPSGASAPEETSLDSYSDAVLIFDAALGPYTTVVAAWRFTYLKHDLLRATAEGASTCSRSELSFFSFLPPSTSIYT